MAQHASLDDARTASAPFDPDLHWGDVMPSPTGERPLPRPAAPEPRPVAHGPFSPAEALRERHARESHALLLWLGLGGALVLALIVGYALWNPPRAAVPAAPAGDRQTGPASPPGDLPAAPLEAGALEAMGAEAPALAAGEPPPSPSPGSGLKPTVVCRLLVDARGQVVRAAVFQPRPDLEPFEAAALAAVRGFRFAPARKDGVPVAAWVNWPVQFR